MLLLLLTVAFGSVRTSPLPVSEVAGAALPAEFPGNIVEVHGEGRIPGRVVGHGARDDPQFGKH